MPFGPRSIRFDGQRQVSGIPEFNAASAQHHVSISGVELQQFIEIILPKTAIVVSKNKNVPAGASKPSVLRNRDAGPRFILEAHWDGAICGPILYHSRCAIIR